MSRENEHTFYFAAKNLFEKIIILSKKHLTFI
nr:MAG TPA: hypothetical protein [Bacteriophage sp.]